jgi:hypothetical protein
VAIAAVEAELADVEFVAIWNGLNGTIANVRVPRREEVPDARDGENRGQAACDGAEEREFVPPRGKNLGQQLLQSAGGHKPRPRICDGTEIPHPRAPKEFVAKTKRSN